MKFKPFSRRMTPDHVIFAECIPTFRSFNSKGRAMQAERTKEKSLGYLLLDFNLADQIDFDFFTIQPSRKVPLSGSYAAFIAPVILPSLPPWPAMHAVHLFTLALSAVFSFTSGRPVKTPRDGYVTMRRQPYEKLLAELAIQYPVITLGPGAHWTCLSQTSLDKLKVSLRETVEILLALPCDKYEIAMQSIRLFQLAHLNKREDFALSYYLLVSAIESVATNVIKTKDVAKDHPSKKTWKAFAKTNPEFKELFQEYCQLLSKDQCISKRFVEFIMTYCPLGQWHELEHPFNSLVEYVGEVTRDEHNLKWMTNKGWSEIYPDDLTEQKIRSLLNDVYKNRSRFVHQGENPPHRDPNSTNRFFDKETIRIKDDNSDRYYLDEIILPNFHLISFIAQRSISNYLRQQIGSI